MREKYIAPNVDLTKQEAIFFSTKEAEEVGFDKFSRRQAELRGIRTLVLDRMCMRHRHDDPDVERISSLCADITDLDISFNLFETWSEILDLVRRLPSLRTFNLSGNRFKLDCDEYDEALAGINDLDLSNTLLNWESELMPLLRQHFSNVTMLNASNNEWASLTDTTLSDSISGMDLSNNLFTSLADVAGIGTSTVGTLILKNCRLARVDDAGSLPIFTSVTELDVRNNEIASWSFINDLGSACPSLKHLRTTGNPLYSTLQDASGKLLTTEDGYMLTVARLPSLELLNYSRITSKERMNAEMYYLNQIAAELKVAFSEAVKTTVLREHPRWKELCKEYGEPASVSKKTEDGVDPNSLTARVVEVTFTSESMAWAQKIPRSFSIYEVIGLVGKRLKVMPLKLRLLLETNENLAHEQQEYHGPEWWDSDEDEAPQACSGGEERNVKANAGPSTIALLPGTRALGTYIDGSSARIRIEEAQTSRR